MGTIIILVTSDVIADQRIHRTASALQSQGFGVTVVGRKLKSTPKKIVKPYRVKLLRLPFSKGPLFYACYNISAFFYLLFHKHQLVHANDLDTLLAARAAGWLRQKPIVYDSHELFTEVPELIDRFRTRRIWHGLETRLTKNMKYCSTVSQGVANELKVRYGLDCVVIRNLPYRRDSVAKPTSSDSPTLIYQGALNMGRGLEPLISSMQYLPRYRLLIVGDGPLYTQLEQQVTEMKLTQRVTLYGKVEHEQLHAITCTAQLGVSIEQDLGLNYRYALPNKVFDYIQAGIPVLASNLPEMQRVVNGYGIGTTINPDYSAHELAQAIEGMINDTEGMEKWRANAKNASKELCWEAEQSKLFELVRRAVS